MNARNIGYRVQGYQKLEFLNIRISEFGITEHKDVVAEHKDVIAEHKDVKTLQLLNTKMPGL